jgi:hypothetical protein
MYKLQLYMCCAASALSQASRHKGPHWLLAESMWDVVRHKVLLGVPLLYTAGYESAGVEYASL